MPLNGRKRCLSWPNKKSPAIKGGAMLNALVVGYIPSKDFITNPLY
jgi:hypothetical protein